MKRDATLLVVVIVNRIKKQAASSLTSSSFTGFYNPLAGFSLLILEVPRSHNDTTQSVGLLWTSDQSVAETST